MHLKKKNICINIIFLFFLIFPILLSAGESIATSRTLIDSDVALAPDERLSNKKQFVFSVTNNSKVPRNLSIQVPSGAIFDRKSTEILNKKSRYSLDFDQKSTPNKIILKESIKSKQDTTKSMESPDKQLNIRESKSTTEERTYRIVLKITDVQQLTTQVMAAKSIVDNQSYESNPIVFKDLINLDNKDLTKNNSSSVAKNSSSSVAKNSSSSVTNIKPNPDKKKEVSKVVRGPMKATPLIDDPGELDGWVETSINNAVKIPINRSDNPGNRNFYMMFGSYNTSTPANPGSGSGQLDATIGSDTSTTKTPDAAFFQIIAKTNNGKAISAVYRQGINSPKGNSQFADTGLALLTTAIDGTKDFKPYQTRSPLKSTGISASTATPTTFPIYKLMYKSDSPHPGLRAYARVFDNNKKQVGHLRVTLEPVNSKGRIRAKIRYISTETTSRKMAWSYSMHMDLDGEHEKTASYSLGGASGLYTYTPNAPSDGYPYKLTFWKSGYPDSPQEEMINSQMYGLPYPGPQWTEYQDDIIKPLGPLYGYGWGIESPNGNPNLIDPGKGKMYKGKGVDHPVWHFKWAKRNVNPNDRFDVNLDFGLSSDVNYKNVEANKSFENLTSKDGFNRVGDRIQFKLEGSNSEWDTILKNITITDVIPKEFDVDTNSFKLVDANGEETILSPDVYNSNTGRLNVSVPGNLTFNQKIYVTFESNISPSASGKTVKNTMDIVTSDVSKSDTSEVEIKVETAPIFLEKKVKNLTTEDTAYATSTKGNLGDVVSYQVAVVNNSKSNPVSAGTVVEDILDKSLSSPRDVKIEYFNSKGEIVNTEIGNFDANGLIKLKYSIPVSGNAKITFLTDITDITKLTINNIAKAKMGTDISSSNNAQITIPKPIIPTLNKDVRNISNNDTEFVKTIDGASGDKVEYRITANNNTGTEVIPKGTFFNDQLDSDLVNEGPGTIEYYSALGNKTGTQTAYFQNGKIKLDQDIEKNGYIKVYFKATISQTSKKSIINKAKLLSGESDAATIIIVTKNPPIVVKEVKNITNSDSDYKSETDATAGDNVEYRIKLTNTGTEQSSADAILNDILDPDLIDIQKAKINYIDMEGTVNATQEASFVNNQIILDHTIPVMGEGLAFVYIKATVKETSKDVISNEASLSTKSGTGTSQNAKLNIKQGSGKITVRYRDRKDETHKLAEDEVFNGKIGESKKVQPKMIPDTLGDWTVVDSSNLLNPDWGSTVKPDWELAHDYTVLYSKEDQIITYRYEESHIGIIANKFWDFGKHDTTATDRNYYLKASVENGKKRPYNVGVEDYYTSKGWTLNVKQDDQFHTNADEKIAGGQKFLDNAVLNFHNGQIKLIDSDDVGATAPVSKLTSEFELTPKGTAVNLMTHTNKKPEPGYYAAHGFGIWEYQFGNTEQADYSIGLRVPKATPRYLRQYRSQLTWSLVIAE